MCWTANWAVTAPCTPCRSASALGAIQRHVMLAFPQQCFHIRTQGSRTPARLPAAVERYLNERRLSYSYVIPGLIELEPRH